MCLKIKRLLAYLTAAAAFMAAAAPPMTADAGGSDIIRWVDFNVTAEVLAKAVALDIEAREKESGYGFIELLAYLAAKNGNKFSRHSASQLEKAAKALEDGTELEELTRGQILRLLSGSVRRRLGGFVGDYVLEVLTGGRDRIEHRYGVKCFRLWRHFSCTTRTISARPLIRVFEDTPRQRVRGVGTPVIAVEGGTVEALGWNRFGGWRIGIRSFDRKILLLRPPRKISLSKGPLRHGSKLGRRNRVYGQIGLRPERERKQHNTRPPALRDAAHI